MKYQKILILGSGALKIGQAGEFDYSGSQAIKALKEEGIKTVLINPNIATIQTSQGLADQVYFLPVSPHFVTKIIEKEKPDGILLSFGGQTALNCGLELEKTGVLAKHNIAVLGTPVHSISLTEDRQLFAEHLRSIDIPTPQSRSAESIEEAQIIANDLGFPLMIRAAFALGGEKSGVVHNQKELVDRVQEALAISTQVLVEKYLHHFKEIEYEVVRDCNDNCITVCNMENMDPLGIHTGESIVIAPSQTLNSREYHHLRSMAIKIVRSLGIVGECNVQYALNPNSPPGTVDYYVIEVNARLSRSSALASKATGYPLAYVAAKLGLGYTLPEVKNQVTKVTTSFFEPALDYVVVKVPRWDLEKFDRVHHKLGSSMKSVGEVMAIDRTFEGALQKAVRMLDIGLTGVTDDKGMGINRNIDEHLENPTHKRLFALIAALRKGYGIKKLHDMTGIDPWFLQCLENIVVVEKKLTAKTIERSLLKTAKAIGFSDSAIATLQGINESQVRRDRKAKGVIPSVFAIDTLAGEFPAKTNYLYMTYTGTHHDVVPLKKAGTMVLGSGPYRIGSSVEFDWTCVRTAQSLRSHHQSPIVVNCNPETVSTDYDVSDRLYFEELSLERVLDIYDFEKSNGIIVSVGGQTPNNLSDDLHRYGIKILGTKTENIDRAENRSTFSTLLDNLDIAQPEWQTFTKEKDAISFADRVGYPVLVRPSYVLSGSAMRVCYQPNDLKSVLVEASSIGGIKSAVTVSKFIEGAREIEYDGVAQKGKLMTGFISEHLEHAGVHSGDATIIYPPEKLYLRTQRKIIKAVTAIIKELQVTGPFNMQFVAKEREVMVIEMNLRASRTFPLLSKASGIDLAELLTNAFFNKAKVITIEDPNYTVVKVPQFSFSRLEGADPALRVEMASTGEVATFGDSVEEAYLKSLLSVGAVWPKKGIFISLGGIDNKVKFLESAWRLKRLNLPLFATKKTAQFLENNGLKTTTLYKIHEGKSPNVLDCFKDRLVDLAINIVDPHVKTEISDDYTIRRSAVDQNIFLITNRHQAELFIKAISEKTLDDLQIKSWSDYQKR